MECTIKRVLEIYQNNALDKLTVMCCADDVRKGYKGCYSDGDGPYTLTPGGASRTLPATLNTDGLTHEQCAQAAGQAGYDVFALQASGNCFMGTIADVVQMKRKLGDDTCGSIPCVAGPGCAGMVNKVYVMSASSKNTSSSGVQIALHSLGPLCAEMGAGVGT
jgi:hypothetical protein